MTSSKKKMRGKQRRAAKNSRGILISCNNNPEGGIGFFAADPKKNIEQLIAGEDSLRIHPERHIN